MMSVKSDQAAIAWARVACRPDVIRRSIKVSVIVGTILIAINHGNLLIGGATSPDLFWKIPLTYCVPYAVSTYAAVDAILSRE